MADDKKTKKQLIKDLVELRRRVEEAESGCRQNAGCNENNMAAQWKLACSLDDIQDGLVLLNKLGTIIDVNQAAADIFGGSKDELIGKQFTQIGIFTQKDVPNLLSRFKDLLCGGKRELTLQITNKLGRTVHLESSVSVRKMPDGSVGIVAIVRDITERKLAEETLRESEQFSRAVIANSPLGISVRNRHGKLLSVNQAWRDIWQVPEETVREYMAAGPDELRFDNKDFSLGEWQSEVARIYREGGRVHIPELRLDNHRLGEPRWVSQTFYAINDESGQVERVVIVTNDITERKLAEEALQNNEEKYRSLFENMLDAFALHKIVLDENNTPIDYIFLEVNNAFEVQTGSIKEEIIGKTITEILPGIENDQADWIGVYGKVALSGEEIGFEQYSELLKKWYSVSAFSPKKNHFATIFTDITERKRTEDALRESEKKFKRITERIYDVIVAADLKGNILYVSPSIIRVFGYQPEELIGKKITAFAPKAEIPHIIETLQLIAVGKDVEGYHSEFIKKNSSIASVELNAVPIIEGGEIVGAQAIIRDITETKRLRELESRAARLEMAGTIAGQVAHDFNNLLAPIMAYPEFIRDELSHDHKAHAYLDAIENAANKIADINQDLLTMGRRGHYSQEVLDLNRIVLQAAQEMESRTRTVAIKMNLCKDLMKIKGGNAQIHRMLINLLVNAQDAMQDIGQITIKTEDYYANNTSVAFGRVPKGEYVKLTITDNGCGIPDKIIQKILDPFFTTKTTDKKQGSGLGLSVVDAVMKDHNGYLDLSSKVGHGTSFYLYFPATKEDTGEDDSKHLGSGTETVLIADDDDIQREVTSRLLTKIEYKVSSVESGEKAIEFLLKNPQDLLILDMVMPGGIDGAETYRRILEISPGQQAIILSGFSESDRVFEAQRLGAGAFVRKPVTKSVIAAAVRAELDRKVDKSVQTPVSVTTSK
ncbi:MAG: PAS domain S-box protein [candidate division Zixibacteria bacterium]